MATKSKRAIHVITETDRFSSSRAYEVFGRELKARIDHRGLTISSLADKAEVGESAMKAACAGTRPLPSPVLKNLAPLIAREDENVNYLYELLLQVCRPNASRTHLARGLLAPVRVGYLESPPFAYASRGNVKYPEGMLVEVFQTFFHTLRINYEWIPVNYDNLIDALENHTVDVITGFVLESPQRRVRTHFVPLPMPFSLGINAVTSSQFIPTQVNYTQFCETIAKVPSGSARKFNLITIADEIADDFLPLIVTGFEGLIRERHRKVADAIRYYLHEHIDRDVNIVFADQMTCYANLIPGSRIVFTRSIGALLGGLLLPTYDPEWASFIEKSLFSLLSAKMPRIGLIFSKYLNFLAPFIPSQDQQPEGRFNPKITPERQDGGLWSLEAWVSAFWPPEVAKPQQLLNLLKTRMEGQSSKSQP